MSEIRTDDLKKSNFDSWSAIEARRAGEVKTVDVKVDNKAATRQAIIVALRNAGMEVRTRSEWKAKEPSKSPDTDWNYVAIAIHHAGNSYSCSADGADQLRKAEATDIGSFGHISYHYAIDCKGVIYEALDIRHKGAHIAGGNTGVIGVVFLADLSLRGEAATQGPSIAKTFMEKGARAGFSELFGQANDQLDTSRDEMPEVQLKAASALTKTLKVHFPIATLGGHREFAAKLNDQRACPGKYGMIVAQMLRQEFKLATP